MHPEVEWKIRETVLAKQEGVEATISLRPGKSIEKLVQANC